MRAQLNRILQSAGLSRLEEPTALMAQLGFLVRDHAHFQSLLVACELPQRRAMYESLRPHLRFTPKPLDVYEAEAAMDAEARQLPIQGEDGKLKEFRAPEVRTWQEDAHTVGVELVAPKVEVVASDTAIAQAAVTAAMAPHRLMLVCRKCTRAQEFTGNTKGDAVFSARKAGWGYDSWKNGSEICPDCLEAD